MKISIPYGDGEMLFDAPDTRVRAVLRPDGDIDRVGLGRAPAEICKGALASPIDSPRLSALARGKKRITILTSDHTRPMPSVVTMPLLLQEIRDGAPDAEILILVATGLHRATTESELLARFGPDIVAREKIIVHDCHDKSALETIGVLPSGGALTLSKYALDTDLLVAEGFIEPHFFAGFSGGRKSVLPGVAGYECVLANHSSGFIADEKAAAGSLKGNPVHRDMAFAAEKAKLAFIFNVILGEGRQIADAVAGDPVHAHAEGCARLASLVAVPRQTAPIVLTSNGGYPLDQNLYQMVKGMDTAAKCCEAGGVIIAVGECRDGVGGEAFYHDFAGGDSPRALTERFLSRGVADTKADQWQSQILARILEQYRVIVVAPLIEDSVRAMGLGYAPDIETALSMADAPEGRPANPEQDIIIIPDGPGIIIETCF